MATKLIRYIGIYTLGILRSHIIGILPGTILTFTNSNKTINLN